MLTSKQKAYLKSMAHPLRPVFQIGKEGLGENMLEDILAYLTKHELMKVSILQNSSVEASEAIEFFTANGIEFVEHIGRTLVLYMHSDKVKEPIVLPEKKK